MLLAYRMQTMLITLKMIDADEIEKPFSFYVQAEAYVSACHLIKSLLSVDENNVSFLMLFYPSFGSA